MDPSAFFFIGEKETGNFPQRRKGAKKEKRFHAKTVRTQRKIRKRKGGERENL